MTRAIRDERAALEREAGELQRSIHLASADLATVLERLRQLRAMEATSVDPRLVVDSDACGRPEVVR